MKDSIQLTTLVDFHGPELAEALMPFILDALEKRGLKLVPAGPGPPPPTAPRIHQAAGPAPEPTAPSAGPRHPTSGRNGSSYYDTVKRDAALLERVKSIGKSLGYDWQVKSWTPEQVAKVVARLEAKMPGDGRRAVR
jgi:hypothetical protein